MQTKGEHVNPTQNEEERRRYQSHCAANESEKEEDGQVQEGRWRENEY